MLLELLVLRALRVLLSQACFQELLEIPSLQVDQAFPLFLLLLGSLLVLPDQTLQGQNHLGNPAVLGFPVVQAVHCLP